MGIVHMCHFHLQIKGGSPIYFIFMQFSGPIWPTNGLEPPDPGVGAPVREILDPSLILIAFINFAVMVQPVSLGFLVYFGSRKLLDGWNV